MAALWRRNSGFGAALPGAGEVPSTSWAPLRVSHQKNGAEPDAGVGAGALHHAGVPESRQPVVDGALRAAHQRDQLGVVSTRWVWSSASSTWSSEVRRSATDRVLRRPPAAPAAQAG